MNKTLKLTPFHESPLLGEILFSSALDQKILKLRYECRQFNQLKWPSPILPQREFNLWRSTCFELFLKKPDTPNYLEFNFSPSSGWDAYEFDSYRSPSTLRRLEQTQVQIKSDEYTLEAQVKLPDSWIDSNFLGNATAVIELIDGSVHYFAYKHCDSKPDFHDPSSLVIDFNKL